MRRKLLAICAPVALTTIALTAALPASAGNEVRIYSGAHGGSFPVKPEKLKYSVAETGAGIAVVYKNIEWADWGARPATGHGKIRGCPTTGSCFTSDVVLKARRQRSRGAIRYYTRLVATFGQQRFGIRLPLPSR